ncbi:MAG: SGNH/GDSL hydrolase family protein [Candidatus Hodarchaeales archaeon]
MPSNNISILCIGNSHTAGFPLYDPSYGGNPKSSYEYWLEKELKENFTKLNFDIENQGICGEMATDIFRRLTAIDVLEKYNFILYWGGANDLGIGRPIERILHSLLQASQFCSTYLLKFFFLTIPPMNIPGMNEPIVDLNRLIFNESQSKVIDIHKALVHKFKLNEDYGIGDGVHLSITGYREVGKTVYQTLSKYL